MVLDYNYENYHLLLLMKNIYKIVLGNWNPTQFGLTIKQNTSWPTMALFEKINN